MSTIFRGGFYIVCRKLLIAYNGYGMVCFNNALVGDMKKWKAQQIGTKSKCYAPRNFVATSIRNVLYTGRAELARWPPLMWMLVAAPRHVKDYTRGTEGRWHHMDRDGAVL